MSRRALTGAGFLLCFLALASPATAKDVRIEPHVAPAADAPLLPEERAVLERALDFDALALESPAPARSFAASGLARPRGIDVSRTRTADGSGTVRVARTLSHEGTFRVGAEFDVAAAPITSYEPGKPLPGKATDKTSGAAWASIGVTRYARVDARIDPGNEQGTLGATLEHSVPLGRGMSVTLRGHYAVSDTFAALAEDDATDLVLSNDHAVRLDIDATGTTLSASVNASSADPVMHSTLGVEQQVYGPLHVGTAITDAGLPTSNRTITAAMRLTW